MAQLIDIKKDFDLGNVSILNMAVALASSLDDSFRVVVKYDGQKYNFPSDNKKNIFISTSREVHKQPLYYDHDKVFAILHNYAELDNWGYPSYGPKVIPLPPGTFINHIDSIEEINPLHERKYDFCFMGQIPHTGTRDKFRRCLDKMIAETGDKFKWYIKYTKNFGEGLDHDEYMEVLGDSRVCLCPQGAYSEETFRFFEAIKLGTIPMVERLPKFWYYENAPMAFSQWQMLDKNLSLTLNFLNSENYSVVSNQVVQYNTTILNPDWLAKFYKHKIEEKFEVENVPANKLQNPL
jgi:hypothetical protein